MSSAYINISKRIRRNLYIILGLLIVGLASSGVLLWLAKGSVDSGLVQTKELSTLVASEQDLQELLAVVDTEGELVQQLASIFPEDQEAIYPVFAMIEQLILDIDSAGVLSFADLEPRQVGGQPALTMDARFLANRVELISLLRRLERLPYVIEIVRVDTQQYDEQSLLVLMEVRLYVASPFK